MNKKILTSILLLAGLFFNLGYACTDFVLVNEEKNVAVGRSMDCRIPFDYEVIIVPKGQKKVSILENNEKGMSWISKYSYGGITIANTDLILDGMNEKGLSMGALWFFESKFPSNIKDKEHTIAMEDISTWILGNFATVDDVKEGLKKVNFWVHYLAAAEDRPTMHFAFHDNTGKSIVLEFIDGKMVISDNPVGILTNGPQFDWQMKNLANYVHITSTNRESIVLGDVSITPDEQGTGLLGMPGDWTSPSRFVKIAYIKHFAKPTKTAEENANLAFHILNVVDIPYGLIRPNSNSKKKGLEFTQWISVKDLNNLKLYYRTYNDLNIHTIDLQNELKKITSLERKRIPMDFSKKITL